MASTCSLAVTGVLLLLCYGADAKLNPCPTARLEDSIYMSGIDLADETLRNSIYLNMDCDLMYDRESYTVEGMPCGMAVSPDCGPPISFDSPKYTKEQILEIRDAVRTVLPAGSPIEPELLAADVETWISLRENATINITFLDEGACFQNALGIISWKTDDYPHPSEWTTEVRAQVLTDNDVSIVFINIENTFCTNKYDEETCGDGKSWCSDAEEQLAVGTTMRLVPDPRSNPTEFVFSAGTSIALFVIVDASGTDRIGANFLTTGFGDAMGETLERVIFSAKQLNENGKQHAVVFLPPNLEGQGYNETIAWAFEDLPPSIGRTDKDFNDISFLMDVSPITAVANSLVHIDTLPPTKSPTMDPDRICANGIMSTCGNTCCDARCGECGGCDCYKASSKGDYASYFGSLDTDEVAGLCCPHAILENAMHCAHAGDVGCIVDDSIICPSWVTAGCMGEEAGP